MFITVFTTACQWSLCSGRWIQFTSTVQCLVIRVVSIILPYTLGLQGGIFPSAFITKTLCVFSYFLCLPHAQSTSFSSIHPTDSLRAGRSGDRIPVEARFSAPVQTGPGAHPASYTMGTGSFPGVKRPRRGVDHPPHPAPRLKKE